MENPTETPSQQSLRDDQTVFVSIAESIKKDDSYVCWGRVPRLGRNFVVTILVVLMMSSQFPRYCHESVAMQMSEYYSINPVTDAAILVEIIFLGLYLPGSFLDSTFFSWLGIRSNLIIAAMLQVLGAIFACVTGHYFGGVIWGDILSALSWPIIRNETTLFVYLWCPAHQRIPALVTVLATQPAGLVANNVLVCRGTHVKTP